MSAGEAGMTELLEHRNTEVASDNLAWKAHFDRTDPEKTNKGDTFSG